MKILVIGANGMLGHAMMDAWSDHNAVGVDVGELDITKPQQIPKALELYRPQAVINCAAYTAVDDCEANEAAADMINGTAVGYLAKACEVHKVPLIHFSTDYVFDGTRESGYQEDDVPTTPVNAYGRTKLHGEKQLRLHASRHYLVRTSWLYGPHGKNFVDTMLQLGKTKPTLSVVNDQHGKPTFTRDLAEFVKALVIERAPYGVYHGVNEESTTWYDFTREIFRLVNISTPVHPILSEQYPLPAKRPTWSTLINTKRPELRPWWRALPDYLAELRYTA